MKGIRAVTFVDHPAYQKLVSRWHLAGKIDQQPYTNSDAFLKCLGDQNCSLIIVGQRSNELGEQLKQFIVEHRLTRSCPRVILLMHEYNLQQRSAALCAGADWVIELDNGDAVIDALMGAVLRRCRPPDGNTTLEFPPYSLNREFLEVHFAGKALRLSQLDFRLLEHMVTHRGKPQSRETLLRLVWNLRSPDSQRRVDTKISQLRKRLELDGRHGWDLQSDRKARGYLFSDGSGLSETNLPEKKLPDWGLSDTDLADLGLSDQHNRYLA